MSKTIKENERQLLNTGDVLVFAFGAMIGWGWVVLSGQWIVCNQETNLSKPFGKSVNNI